MDVKPTVEEDIPAGPGTTLHVETFRPAAAPRAVVVGLHGFSSHCGLLRHVGDALARAGFTAVFFDCRGHGCSTGRRGYIERFANYVEDLDMVVKRAREAHPGIPLLLLGHSQGATIVLDYVLGAGGQADGLLLATPWLGLQLKPPALKLVLARLAGRLWPTLTMGNEIRARDVSRNPIVHANFDTDPLVHHVA